MVDVRESMQMLGVNLGMGARQLRADADTYKLNTRDILTRRGRI